MDLWPFPYRFERERRNAWLAQSKKTKLDASLSNVDIRVEFHKLCNHVYSY